MTCMATCGNGRGRPTRRLPYRDDDGRNALTGSERRIVRGGSWYDRPQRATSDYRLSFRPYHRVFTVGMRVMMAADPTAIPVAVK